LSFGDILREEERGRQARRLGIWDI
jgi:hypothetical protein